MIISYYIGIINYGGFEDWFIDHYQLCFMLFIIWNAFFIVAHRIAHVIVSNERKLHHIGILLNIWLVVHVLLFLLIVSWVTAWANSVLLNDWLILEYII